MSFQFDPRDLISPPFRECPQCGNSALGVLEVGGQMYKRRCRECWYTDDRPLWPLDKKVIYVDQFAISNMMKAIDVTAKGHDRTAADPFWLSLFEGLERVCKLQLAVCPNSDAHLDESLLSPFFGPLKRMYEQLSHDVSFDFLNTIEQRQVHVALTAWLRGETPTFDFSPEQALNGRLNDWNDRFIISVDMSYPEEMVEGIRSMRDQVHENQVEMFREFCESTEADFDYWFEREQNGVARAIRRSCLAYVERCRDIATGRVPFRLENLYSSQGLDLYRLIVSVMKEQEVPPEEIPSGVMAFLDSDALKSVPFNRLRSLLWAVIAQKAVAGQRRPPNRGTLYDIQFVSVLLPYC